MPIRASLRRLYRRSVFKGLVEHPALCLERRSVDPSRAAPDGRGFSRASAVQEPCNGGRRVPWTYGVTGGGGHCLSYTNPAACTCAASGSSWSHAWLIVMFLVVRLVGPAAHHLEHGHPPTSDKAVDQPRRYDECRNIQCGGVVPVNCRLG